MSKPGSPKEKEPIISLHNIHKTYLLGLEGVAALRGVNISIKEGEFVCIYGTSGGGKTTLLNLIGTIDRPTKGDILLCGTHITQRTPDKVLSHLRLMNIGFVFQTFNLLTALTALENVELPMILANVPTKKRHARAKELLKSVGMGARMNHFPSQLSGGEQQRVTIARALANNPKILILDEPTGDLDTVNTSIVLKLMHKLNKEQGITIVMVTHDVTLKHIADRVIWMRDGLVQTIEDVNAIQHQECMMQLEGKLQSKPVKQFSETEFRKPCFYAPQAYIERKSMLVSEKTAVRIIAHQRCDESQRTCFSECAATSSDVSTDFDNLSTV